MKKILIIIAPIFFSAIVFLGFNFFISKNAAKGALQVTSVPKSNVYLNGVLIGQTPLCKCDPSGMIKEGEYTVRLVPLTGEIQPFEEKIKIVKSVLTVMDRTFSGGLSSDGSIISLTPIENSKEIQLLVISFPDNAQVFVDNVALGNTPLLQKNLTESDHEVKIVKTGYKEKIIRIHTVSGFKLNALVFLGVNPEAVKQNPAASPSAAPSIAVQEIIILQTPTGFLRVREDASLNSVEVGRVTPGDTFGLVDEKEGWFKIKLVDGKEGWVSNQYAQKK
ncbi:MAG: PEGA domain-containing protein [Candidatus Levybacteria bacterium]|nr:PEGA domain-containing protein [Candidatus Levybacteria bacterium]